MTIPSWFPEDPEREPWDAVVIGTGMGGGTIGYELARLGRRVLFLEKGRFVQRDAEAETGDLTRESDDPELRMRRGQWPFPLRGSTSFGEVEFFFPLGCGSGGSSLLYAAALERLLPADFEPRANFPEVPEAALPEAWPVSYAQMEPWYEKAERLYRVRGTPDPLQGGGRDHLLEPLPLSPRDEALRELFVRSGLHPYRVQVGCEYVDGCQGCGGVVCLRECKADAGHIGVVPAVEKLGAKLLPRCEVLGFEAGPDRIERVHCSWNGRPLAISATIVILASGALATPRVLLASRSAAWPEGLANPAGLVGRHLMLHTSDFIAVRPDSGGSTVGPEKSLALNDFYFAEGRKLGTFQAVGLPVSSGIALAHLRQQADRDPRWWRPFTRPFLRLAAYAGSLYFRNAVVYSSIVEDLPYPDNRVVPDASTRNGMRFEYRYPQELRERNELFRRCLSDSLGRRRVFVLSSENNLNYGHACGTCRFGIDPATSVLDRDNRAHGIDNLYVVDASFFPSSGGKNPSLTIAANALRVAHAIHGRLP